MEKIPGFLMNIVDSLIVLAVLFICTLLSLFSFNRLGRAALLAVAGFMFLIGAWLLDVAFSAWAVFAYDYTSSRDAYEAVFWAKTAFRIPALVIGFVLLTAAVLMNRQDAGEISR